VYYFTILYSSPPTTMDGSAATYLPMVYLYEPWVAEPINF